MKRMTPGHWRTAMLTFVALFAAAPVLAAVQPVMRHDIAATPAGRLMAFGSRSAEQQRSASDRKLDGALAELARHLSLVRPASALSDLHSLSPAARFAQLPGGAAAVLVDAVTRGDPQKLKDALVALGLKHPSVYVNDVSGWLPLSEIGAAAARAEVQSIRAAMPHTRAGAVTTQGDFAQGSSALRAAWPTLNGSGVMVGVLSDSFNCYAVYAAAGSGVPASGPNGYASNGFTADAQMDISSGDLPASVDVLEEAGQGTSTCMDFGAPDYLPYGDEGRAMLQIVHHVAPGASLAFHTADEGEADFANGIAALAAAGAKVIADDVGYFDEPYFQDGLVAQAVDAVSAQGVAYFSAAGNNSRLAYENTAPSFSTHATTGPNAGEYLLNFDTSGATTTPSLSVTFPPLLQGEFVAIVVEWDQPYVTGAPGSPGPSSSIDLCVSGASGYLVTNLDGSTVTCTGANMTGPSADPVQVLVIGNPANAAAKTAKTTVSFEIGLANGTPAPGRIKLVVEDDGAGSMINAFDTQSPTLQGHPAAAGAAAVGAAFFAQTPACGTSPAVLERFSSAGGDPILFNNSGSRLTTAVVRQKPNFVGPDGVNNTFLGFVTGASGSGVSECQNDKSFPSFFGTSAATPHIAAAAALMLQANPALTPAQITTALQDSAQAMGVAPNFNSGYGFVQVDAAFARLPPAAPTLTLAAASISAGGSTTLSWSATNTTGCTASGAWSGAQAASGSQTLMPAAAGSLTYTLTCLNDAGSASSSAILSVQAPPSSGGGGTLDALALAALAGLLCLRRAARRRLATLN
jgi:subtilase family protein